MYLQGMTDVFKSTIYSLSHVQTFKDSSNESLNGSLYHQELVRTTHATHKVLLTGS